MKPLKKLHRRHIEFIDHYITSKNAKASAIKAGYKEKNAYNTGCLLLQDKLIREEISKKFKQYDITNEELIAEYIKLFRKENTSDGIKKGVLDSLAKIKDMMNDKQETTINVSNDIDTKEIERYRQEYIKIA